MSAVKKAQGVTFPSAAAFRKWLSANHASETELILRCYKTSAKEKGLGYKEALDEALCFGWIDGVRRACDDETFTQRFSPRKKKSVWSAVNIRRATELEAQGRMQRSGLDAFRARTDEPAGYSFEHRGQIRLDPGLEKQLRRNRAAWNWFEAQSPSFRRTHIFWIMSAKKEETRARRFEALLKRAVAGERRAR